MCPNVFVAAQSTFVTQLVAVFMCKKQALLGSFKVFLRWVWGVLFLPIWIRCPLKRLGWGRADTLGGWTLLSTSPSRSAPICRVNVGNYHCARLFMNDSISSRLSRHCITPKGEKAGRPRPRQTLQCSHCSDCTSDRVDAADLAPWIQIEPISRFPHVLDRGRVAQGDGQLSKVRGRGKGRRSGGRRRRKLDSWPLLELLIF